MMQTCQCHACMPYTSLIKADVVKCYVAAYMLSEPVDKILFCGYICMNAAGKRALCLLCHCNDLISNFAGTYV